MQSNLHNGSEPDRFVVASGPIGLTLAEGGDFPGIVISCVKETSPLFGRVFSGEYITAIDEVDITGMTLHQATQIILERSNKQRTLKVLKALQARESNSNIVANDCESDSKGKYGVLWDFRLAEKAKQGGEDIDRFLSKTVNSAAQIKRLELLHECNYSVKNAENKYNKLKLNPDWISFDRDEAEGFAKAMTERKRNFSFAGKQLNRSVTACLIYYYSRFKASAAYNILKETFQASTDEDYCAICDDGGDLICCDSCGLWYHPTCLSPPVVGIPEGDWFCTSCEMKDRHFATDSNAKVNKSDFKNVNKD